FQMRRLSLLIIYALLFCSFSSALSNVVRFNLGPRMSETSNSPTTAELMLDDTRLPIASPFVSPLLSLWARPRRVAYKRYNGEGEQ
ncbi:hypothetical protein PENTCL1PPCAC_4203, partial [Pristionchus entomophagus]